MKRKLRQKLSMAMVALLLLAQLWVPEAVGAADASTHVTLKAVYYANAASYPSATTQVETVSASEATIGGAVRWDYGAIVFTPEDGYTVTKAYFEAYNEGDEGVELSLSTFGEVKANLTGSPSDLETKIDGISDSAVAAFVNRGSYQQINEQCDTKLHVVLKNASNQESTAIFYLQNDTFTDDKTITLGDTVNLLTDYENFASYVTEHGYGIADFNVQQGSGAGYEEVDFMSYTQGSVTSTPAINGFYVYRMEDKHTGIKWELNTNVKEPILANNIVVSTSDGDVEFGEIGYGNRISVGVTPDSPKAELSLDVTLPEGVTIDWQYTKVPGLYDGKFTENGTRTATETLEDGSSLSVVLTHSYSNGKHHFTAKNINMFSSIYLAFTVGTQRVIKSINYYIEPEEDTKLFVNCKVYADNYYINAYQVYDLFDFVTASSADGSISEAEAHAEFLKRLDDGRYKFYLADATLLKDDSGKYNGKIVFYHGGFLFYVYDDIFGQYITSSDASMICNYKLAVVAGDKIDVKEIMGSYWNDSDQVAVTGTGFTYDAETKKVTTPSSVSGTYQTGTIVVKKDIYGGGDYKPVCTINVNVCSKDNYDAAVKDIVSNDLVSGDSLEVDSSNIKVTDTSKGTEISKDILNALAGLSNVHLEVKATHKDRSITWVLDSDNLSSTNKNLMVNVEVGKADLQENKTGLEVKFKDNGTLPGETTVRVELTKNEAISLGVNDTTKHVYFQYLNPTTGKYVKEQQNLVIHEDPNKEDGYYIELPVTHNSTFVLTTASALEDVAVKGDNSNGNTNDTATPPKTGDATNVVLWIMLILAGGALVAGRTYFVRRK